MFCIIYRAKLFACLKIHWPRVFNFVIVNKKTSPLGEYSTLSGENCVALCSDKDKQCLFVTQILSGCNRQLNYRRLCWEHVLYKSFSVASMCRGYLKLGSYINFICLICQEKLANLWLCKFATLSQSSKDLLYFLWANLDITIKKRYYS